MALDYHLYLGEGLSLDEANRLIDLKSGSAGEPGHDSAEGLHMVVASPRPHSVEMIQESVGFTPGVVVSFRTAKDQRRPAGEDVMISLVMALLGQSQADAVLLFNGESVVLRRRAGQLQLSRQWPNLLSARRLLPTGLPGESVDLPTCLD